MEKAKSRLTAQTTALSTQTEAETGDQFEIDLVELFFRLVENAKYIISAALIGAVAAWLFTVLLIAPKYTATSKLYVLNAGDSAINLQDLQIGNYLASDYQEVFKNWHVHEMVIQKLDLPYSYKRLSDMVSVSNPTNTRILYIKVTSTDPDQAKAIADAYAEVAREFIATTMDTKEPNMFEEALRPSSPSSPSRSCNVLIGFFLGALAAIGIITVRFLLDDKIHSSEDVEKYIGIPTLGVLPLQQSKFSSRQKKQHKRGASA